MQCMYPIRLPPKDGREAMDVGCGKCKFCRENRRIMWSFRLMQEFKHSKSAAFYTLTYDDMQVPLKEDPPLSGSYKQILLKSDLQKFMKRLRRFKERQLEKQVGKPRKKDDAWYHKIRYFAVGEYGELSDRPHYHAIIFNVPYEIQVTGIDKCWKKGNIHVGEVNEASIHYVTKYALKEENFALMSRKPGIGFGYLKQEVNKFHIDGNEYISMQGFKHPLPRYFLDKLKQSSINYNEIEPGKYQVKQCVVATRKIKRIKKEMEELEKLSNYNDPYEEKDLRLQVKYDNFGRINKKGKI